MADTLGGIVDKLITVDMKMWNNQEILYKIRRMTFEEFKDTYFSSESGASELFECLKKACDLNVQRNALIDEIDVKIVNLIEQKFEGKDLDDGANIQRKFKTY